MRWTYHIFLVVILHCAVLAHRRVRHLLCVVWRWLMVLYWRGIVSIVSMVRWHHCRWSISPGSCIWIIPCWRRHWCRHLANLILRWPRVWVGLLCVGVVDQRSASLKWNWMSIPVQNSPWFVSFLLITNVKKRRKVLTQDCSDPVRRCRCRHRHEMVVDGVALLCLNVRYVN